MITVFRCSKCKYVRDTSGLGAAKFGGRWNSKGTYLLYASSNPSLAFLESLVHMSPLMPGADYCIIQIQSKEESVISIQPEDLQKDWQSDPSPEYLKHIGDRFVAEGKYLMLKVPSVVLPIDWNILINPKHALMATLIISQAIPVKVDHRLKSKVPISGFSTF